MAHVARGARDGRGLRPTAWLRRLRSAAPRCPCAGPSAGEEGRPTLGALRYTTDSSYFVVKTLTRGQDRVAVNRAAARRIIELAEFRGSGAGPGEEWLSDCANGPLTSSEGVGGPTEWLKAGNLQHITHVVRSLSED
ncbi:beta family protein [Streptomyces qinglanensis]|uniref:beta family protein n=1 Tax=Streptomyces qinglanensis TaxID=943816 RepID=UPI003D7486A8